MKLLHTLGDGEMSVGDLVQTIGAGQAMKALNNLVSAGGFLIAVEAVLMGQRFGLDPGLVVDVQYLTLTGEGRLRQPAYRGIRRDLAPSDLGGAEEVREEGGHSGSPRGAGSSRSCAPTPTPRCRCRRRSRRSPGRAAGWARCSRAGQAGTRPFR